MFAVHQMRVNSVCCVCGAVLADILLCFCAAVDGKESQNSNALRIESLLLQISKFQLG